MRIAIVTGAYKRHELLDLFCRYYQWLQQRIPFDLVVACSETQTKQIVRHYGHTAIMVNNHPLTRKFNMAAQHAAGADYCIMLGSDDFLSEATLRHYVNLFEQGYDYIGVLDWWFYNSLTGAGLYWKGYDTTANRGHLCGAGRALSKRLMEAVGWQPWEPGYDKILDTGMDVRLARVEHTKHAFNLNDAGLFALDIKTEENMTKFAHWPNTVSVNSLKMLGQHLPEWRDEIINL